MSKLRFLLPIAAGLAGASAVPVAAGAIGDDAAVCRAGKSAVLVRVSGFKRASGKIKIGVYDAGHYLKKGGTVSKDTLMVRSSGPVDICLAVPRPGRYAVAIHHDLNANGDKDANDGAGYSNNPRLSLTNLKPAFSRTSVQVGSTPRRVGVVLQYRKGLSVGPIAG